MVRPAGVAVRPFDLLRRLPTASVPVILLCIAFHGAAGATTREFYFERLGSERGLAQGSVGAIVQDPQGFVWVGTQGGLHRYDGQRYRIFRHEPRDPGSLPDSVITALGVGADPTLWVGTYSQYLAALDLRTGAIRRFAAPAVGGRGARHVQALLAHEGTVWVGTGAGLDRVDARSGARRRILSFGHVGGPSPQQLLRDRAGRIWYATRDGLFRIEGGRALRVDAGAATSLLEDRAGRLWIGGDAGLDRLDGGLRRPAWRPGPAGGGAQVRSVVQAPDGHLWLAVARDGLRRFDPRTGLASAIREAPSLPGTLPENTVDELMIDRGGVLWVGGALRGASVTDPRGSRFVFLLPPPAGRAQSANESVRAVHGTPGTLWIGTDGGRLWRHELASGDFEDLTPRLPAGRVVGFADAGGGRLWLGTTTGLVELDTATRTMRPVELGRFSSTSLRSLGRDRTGALWLGTNGQGVLHHDPGTGRTRQYRGDPSGPAPSQSHMHAVLVDRRGRVWLGTGDGLELLDPATGNLQQFRQRPGRADSLPSNLVRSLLEDASGTIWVGTQAGLSRVVETGGKGSTLRFEQPLDTAMPGRRSPIVFSLQEAPGGLLWAGTDAGLLRFQPSTGRARAFDVGDGLQDLEFNGGASGRLADGRVAFGGVRGLNLVDPTRADPDAVVAPVRLLSARIGSDDAPEAMLWPGAVLAIPAGVDLLRVRVGALDFSPAARPAYRYRIAGVDEGWVENGTQRDITYTHLPPGRYTLEVQADDRSGGWSPGGLSIPIEVARPLWQEPLILVLLAAILLSPGAFALWQWRMRRQRERRYIRRLREREERLKLALWASGEQFWDYDLRKNVMYRVQAENTFGERAGSVPHATVEAEHRIHPEDAERVQRQLRRHLRGEIDVFESQHRVVGPDREWMWIRARGRVVERDGQGRALRVAGTARDITATRRADRDRRVASEVLRSMAEAVAVFDDEFQFVSVNPAFTRMTGYTEPEIVGRPTNLVDSRQHEDRVYQTMREELLRDGRWSGELWQRRKDGTEFLCWLQASVVLDNAGQRGHWVAVLSDITDQKRAEQELRYLANYDTLTGLPNRALLSERLSRAIVRARRLDRRLAVLFLDLDRFKDINDSLGHAAGDAILRATAARLQHTVGAHHTVARLGGDEFTVVLEHLEDAAEAEAVARQLLAAFEQPLDTGDLQDITISPSIGIAIYPDHADTPSDLLKHADIAMYQAKAAGRRTYTCYTGSMDVDIRRRATLSAALRKVIDRAELQLVYQPKMAVGSGRLTGVEALLRWHSAEFGLVSPAHFIPLAEESGLILEIGEWALREACEQLRDWRQLGIDVTMAVNVSALQLRRGDLPGLIERTLHETGLPRDCLELELTESIVMAEETWSVLHAIRALGVRMAIDDFGTGYSSLAYLKRLPIQTLKIDKEFIGDLDRDPDDAAITSAVIAMGHSLGLNVVAEGVETVGQLDFLRRHGCDEIQGYWLARPMEADGSLQFLRAWAPRTRQAPADVTG
jgi:diguanylate cyclase (GGDEF)-like protein/PAS domain S-box-containing protein